MEKNNLINILSEILIPIGFKRKGNYWLNTGNDITKIINLQKSRFGNCFYINYGYILNAIPLDGVMHIYKRVSSLNMNFNADELLDLENNLIDKEREDGLRLLLEVLVKDINSVNTEADILFYLQQRPHLNDIPLVVKKYFHLIE